MACRFISAAIIPSPNDSSQLADVKKGTFFNANETGVRGESPKFQCAPDRLNAWSQSRLKPIVEIRFEAAIVAVSKRND